MAWFSADFEAAIAAVEKGCLPPDALSLRISLESLQRFLVGAKLLAEVSFFVDSTFLG